MQTTDIETISVIIAVHDQSKALEENLPLYLQQSCDVPYRVIVVDEASTDATPDVLKRLRADYSHLYTTFMPAYRYSPLRHRLAINIGLKAARGEWVVMVDITRPPCSAVMLQDMLSQVSGKGCPAATAYYQPKSGSLRYVLWDSVGEMEHVVSKAERQHAGHDRSRWMNIRRGRYDALIVQHSHAGELLPYIYRDIRGRQLAALRLKVFMDSFSY